MRWRTIKWWWTKKENLAAVGRLYINADNEALIRFMAVHPCQDKGLGTLMAMTRSSLPKPVC